MKPDNTIKGIEVIRCKCGNIYSACALWDRDDSWRNEIKDALKKGHTTETLTRPFTMDECACKTNK